MSSEELTELVGRAYAELRETVKKRNRWEAYLLFFLIGAFCGSWIQSCLY